MNILQLPTDAVFEILTKDMEIITKGYYFRLLLTCKKFYNYIYLYQKYTNLFKNDDKPEISKVILLNYCIEHQIALPCLYLCGNYKLSDDYFNYMKQIMSKDHKNHAIQDITIISYLEIVKPYMRLYSQLSIIGKDIIKNCPVIINSILEKMIIMEDFVFNVEKYHGIIQLIMVDIKVIVKFALSLIKKINKKRKITEPIYAVESITEGTMYNYDIYDNHINYCDNFDDVYIIKFVTVYFPY